MAVPRDALTQKELGLLTLWESRRDGRDMPTRGNLIAEDLFPWMGSIHLLVPVEGGADFRYKVFATRTLLSKDPDLTGKLTKDWPDERSKRALKLYGTVYTEGCPIYSALPERHQLDWIFYSRICLPLGSKGVVTHIVSMLTRHRGRPKHVYEPCPVVLADS